MQKKTAEVWIERIVCTEESESFVKCTPDNLIYYFLIIIVFYKKTTQTRITFFTSSLDYALLLYLSLSHYYVLYTKHLYSLVNICCRCKFLFILLNNAINAFHNCSSNSDFAAVAPSDSSSP